MRSCDGGVASARSSESRRFGQPHVTGRGCARESAAQEPEGAGCTENNRRNQGKSELRLESA